jgi:hypothetical protein
MYNLITISYTEILSQFLSNYRFNTIMAPSLLHVCICVDLLLTIVCKYIQEKFEIYYIFPSALQ